jgi:Cu+-exporting ATPase
MIASLTIKINGMTCGACISYISNALECINGISSVAISIVTDRGTIRYEPAVVTPATIINTIEECGFEAEIINNSNNLSYQVNSDLSISGSNNTLSKDGSTKMVVSIQGMTCGACVAAVTSSLESLAGIETVSVSLVTELGTVEYNPTVVSSSEILACIEDCGFDAEKRNVTDSKGETLLLKVYGMNKNNQIIDFLKTVNGIENVQVDSSKDLVQVTYSKDVIGIRDIVDNIEYYGLSAILESTADNSLQLEALSKVKAITKSRNKTLLCLLFSVPVIIISKFAPSLRFPILQPELYFDDVINLCLTVPVQFWIGKHFYTSLYYSIRYRHAPTMDVLVCISTSCAFFFSLFCMFYNLVISGSGHPHTLWETSAMLITFITAGKYLENKAKGQTSVALSKLMSLTPPTARIYVKPESYLKYSEKADSVPMADLEQRVISADLIQPGDIVVILPGEKVPADGVVLFGESYVDESLITGESIPQTKVVSDSVICGSINGYGRLDIQVTRAGEDTKLAHIVQLVQDAQTSKTDVQRFADYIAGIFVPIVLFLGSVTFVFWIITSHVINPPPKPFMSPDGKFMVCLHLCISVIVVACPCALGLATPTAVMVGTGIGASHGILIKGGAVLETASKVTTVLFDKTGTLTTGQMTVSNVMCKYADPALWWRLIGAVEQSSEHPIGRSLVELSAQEHQQRQKSGTSSEDELYVMDFKVVVGQGVTAVIQVGSGDRNIKVSTGNLKLLTNAKIKVPQDALDETIIAGQTVVFVAINDLYAGYITLSDTIREQAKVVINELKSSGYSVGIISGDHPSVVSRVAQELGVERSWGGVSPEGKLEIIKSLESGNDEEFQLLMVTAFENDKEEERKRQKEVVAFVGDGINDSPALASASLGISITGATDAALEAADIVLVRDSSHVLLDLLSAFDLSSTTFRRIKMNLGWALVYNMLMIPVAMGVFIPFGIMMHPVVAGAAMACSSVSVVMSSLLLRLWKPHYSNPASNSNGTESWTEWVAGWFRRESETEQRYQLISEH